MFELIYDLNVNIKQNMKRTGFAKQLERLNSKQLEQFEDFLSDFLPEYVLDTDYSDKLFNRFYELPEAMQYGAFIEFLKEQELLKDFELDYTIITKAFRNER